MDKQISHLNYLKYYKNNTCCDCNVTITKYSKRCCSCSTKYKIKHEILGKSGNKASNFKHGKYISPNFCIDCKIRITPESVIYGNHRCKKCAKKLIKKPLNYCIDCKKEISNKGAKRCNECNGKYYRGKNSFNYGKTHKGLKGRKNGMFGKKAKQAKRIEYKEILMRSSWEVGYAKYLDRQNIKWQYEPKTFDFKTYTYTPDFYLPERDTYVEIKGWWRRDAKKRFNLFKRLYPKTILITKKEYDSIC